MKLPPIKETATTKAKSPTFITGRFDRFTLEEKIMDAWRVVDDLDLVTRGILDEGWGQDQAANALLGIKQMYELRFQEMFDSYEKCLKNKSI